MKKKYAVLIALGGILNSCASQNDTTLNRPSEIEWEDTTINLGTIKVDSQYRVVFKYRNVGDSSLVIKDSDAECGCTIIESVDGRYVEPGNLDSIVANFVYPTEGPVDKKIVVTTNSKRKIHILKIVANVKS